MLRPLFLTLSLLTAIPALAADLAETSTPETPSVNLPLPVRNVLAHRQLPTDTLSLFVFNLDQGRIELSLNPDTPRNPASVMKLVTTLVALDELGPAYRWRTEAWAMGDLTGEALEGDLLLKGYGDPFLVTERVWQMLRELRLTGLRSIEGDLLIDDSFFDVGDYDPAAFDRQPLRAYNVAPNAMMMNFKVVRYRFVPDRNAGGVIIRMDPQLDNLKVVNRLSVSNGSCRGYQRGIAIIPNDAFDQFTFSGRFPSGCDEYSMTRAALEHNEFTYGMFRAMWQEVGGEFDGQWRNVAFEPGDDDEPLLVFESQPLADVISRVNKYSNNVMARHLLLTVAAERYGAPGTEQNGRQSVRDWMTERGLDANSIELTNGAGLSRSARVTARQLADMLRFAYGQPYMPEFLSSMSLSGLDGTTTRRFDETDQLAGQAHVKTGRLDHVSAIAGFIQSQSGERHVVVTLHNHNDVHRGYGAEVQEALLRWVYSR